jgi:hypothetical protein
MEQRQREGLKVKESGRLREFVGENEVFERYWKASFGM